MKFRKNVSIYVVVFLVAGVLSNSALAERCFCGQTCLHTLQPKSIISVIFHMRCPGTLCKGCNLEESLTLKAIKPVKQFFDLNRLDTVFIQPPVNDYSFSHEKLVQTIQQYIIIPSLSLYLQNLTFLC
jgi:hypothetical protein